MALSDNVWWTRKARIQAETRLLNNASHAQILLLWYSFYSVAVSIYFLKFASNSDLAAVASVIFSVLVLCVSVFINGLSFKERAALIKECYERLGSLQKKIKQAEDLKQDIQIYDKEYEEMLNMCENHIERDYIEAWCRSYLSHNDPEDNMISIPTKFIWSVFVFDKLKRFSLLFIMYILPVFLSFLMQLS